MLSPSPIQKHVETQEKLRVQVCWGGGDGWENVVALAGDLLPSVCQEKAMGLFS